MLINTKETIIKVIQQQANIKGSDGNITLNTQNKEKAATQNEKQQIKTKQEIINDIIKILAENNLTIADSKDILHETSKEICKQTVSCTQNRLSKTSDIFEQMANDENFKNLMQKLITHNGCKNVSPTEVTGNSIENACTIQGGTFGNGIINLFFP